MKEPILVIGGANMDILGMPGEHFAWRDSNIGRVMLSPGGVGRNMAEYLARAGARVELACVLGDDAFGLSLSRSCDQLGIGLRHALRVHAASCVYMAIHDAGGDMAAAINDMRAMDLMDAAAIGRLPPSGFSLCVLDANLSGQALEAAAAHMQVPLMADPVSCEKAPRLLPILPRLHALKPNLMEARHLTGRQTPEEAAAALMDMGVAQVYISLGKDGLYCASADTQFLLPAPEAPPGPATGAGDAMTAGLAYAIARGLGLREAAHTGLQFARNHLNLKAAEAAK